MIVVADDGWRLGVSVHLASGVRRGVVIALPAMMVDARTLDRPAGHGLASTLARAGFEVWRADFRGHGSSPPLARAGAAWTYDDLVRRDVPALVAAARAGGGPVAVVGHSLGGHVALAAAGEGTPIDVLVLLAANVWMPSLEPSARRRAQKAAAMAAFSGVSRLRGRFPSRRLRWGPADESLGYVRDLARFWREDAWRARDGTSWTAGLARYRGRVLAVAGAGDVLLAHPEAARRFVDPLPSGSVDFWIAGRPRLGWDPDHAGLAADPRSAPLWDDLARWLRPGS